MLRGPNSTRTKVVEYRIFYNISQILSLNVWNVCWIVFCKTTIGMRWYGDEHRVGMGTAYVGMQQGHSQDFHSEGDTPSSPLPPASFSPALSSPFPTLPLLPFHLPFPLSSTIIQLRSLGSAVRLRSGCVHTPARPTNNFWRI